MWVRASHVPRFPPALLLYVASLVQGAGVSDLCPITGQRCLSSVSDLGTCLTRFWLFCFNLCLVVCGAGPGAMSDTEILKKKHGMCLWEGRNPGKRAPDCLSAPFRESTGVVWKRTDVMLWVPLPFCTVICLLLKLKAWTQPPDGWGPLQNRDSWTWDLVVYFLNCLLSDANYCS